MLAGLGRNSEGFPEENRPRQELQEKMNLSVCMTETEIKSLKIRLKAVEDLAVLMGRAEKGLHRSKSDSVSSSKNLMPSIFA